MFEETAAPAQDNDRWLLSSFMDILSPTQRAVTLYLMEGRSWRETGRILGCSSANIAYHVRQISALYRSWAHRESSVSDWGVTTDTVGEGAQDRRFRKGGS